MRKNKLPEFTLLLEQFFTEYMPFSSGLSPNTIRSYKHSFRLLFQYIYQVQKKNADEILFQDLDHETIDGFLKWIETERGCSASTRNLRLSALASFSFYAQNRNFEAATVFANAVRRTPVKKEAIQPRITFSLDEVSVLLHLPNPQKRLGFRDQVLLNLMYASGARAQEICDLKVRDFFVEKNLYKLTITGKGNKTRRIVIAKPSGILLKRYLEETGRAGQLETYIFSSQTHPQIPIAKIDDAGITTTGAASEGNQLPQLLSEYSAYRTQNNLWTIINNEVTYAMNTDGKYYRCLNGQEVVLNEQ